MPPSLSTHLHTPHPFRHSLCNSMDLVLCVTSRSIALTQRVQFSPSVQPFWTAHLLAPIGLLVRRITIAPRSFSVQYRTERVVWHWPIRCGVVPARLCSTCHLVIRSLNAKGMFVRTCQSSSQVHACPSRPSGVPLRLQNSRASPQQALQIFRNTSNQ